MSEWAKRLFRTGHNAKKSRPRSGHSALRLPQAIDNQPSGGIRLRKINLKIANHYDTSPDSI
jgi:hypothetical protein